MSTSSTPVGFLGLRTVIYPAPDLASAKAWYTSVLGFEPYFDEPFYVGFNVGGYELALDPNGDPLLGPLTYWGVADADAAIELLVAKGATPRDPVAEVGNGIRVGSVKDPTGSFVGVIQNPHFAIPADVPAPSGPGR